IKYISTIICVVIIFFFFSTCVLYFFFFFFFSSRRRHTRSVSAFLLNRSSDLIGRAVQQELLLLVYELNRSGLLAENEKIRPILRSEERRVGKECRSRWWAYH